MADSQLVVIVVAALVAAVVLFRLYTVLGRRTGNERAPQPRFGRVPAPAETATPALPDRPAALVDATTGRVPSDAERGLVDIKLADRNFESDRFIAGAKKAHEMIVTAYWKGDRAALKPLLSGDVYAAFDAAIRQREDQKHAVRFTLVGYRDVAITDASLKNSFAEITVSFQLQFISATLDAENHVIDGDPALVRDVTDVWSFSRDIRASDPNWSLVATSGGEV
jgi:predicted lipid-binding transport protein (Tim44 family)